jgi:hypothetical protein
MRTPIYAPLLALLLAVSPMLAQQPLAPVRTPVIVELFTSEGCSSCPPADALLARLDRDQPVPNADIIVLGEHVDYWDSLGWHDRFSSPSFTQRQRDYQALFRLDDIYTPQIVINGLTQLAGSDSQGVARAIARAAATTAPLQLGSVEVRQNDLALTLRDAPKTSHTVNLYAALVDPSDTTEVRAGENAGRTLHHAGVVRTLALLCRACTSAALSRNPLTLSTRGVANLNGMRLVVFASAPHNGPAGAVTAAISCVLNPGDPALANVPFPANSCPGPLPSGIVVR